MQTLLDTTMIQAPKALVELELGGSCKMRVTILNHAV